MRRDADSFWHFAQQMSQEVRAWPSWKLKAAARAFCSPQQDQVRQDTKSRESTPKPATPTSTPTPMTANMEKNHMENLYTIKRLEAMDGFLGEMIDKLENHSEVTFLLDLSRSIKTEPDFDNGTFYAQCRVGMQTAAHCLRTIQTRIHFSLKELRETEGKNDSKLF